MEEEKRYTANTHCVFFQQGETWQDTAVLCTKKEIRAGKCAACGFNPDVKRKRLSAKYGAEAAEELCRYSESLNEKENNDDS